MQLCTYKSFFRRLLGPTPGLRPFSTPSHFTWTKKYLQNTSVIPILFVKYIKYSLILLNRYILSPISNNTPFLSISRTFLNQKYKFKFFQIRLQSTRPRREASRNDIQLYEGPASTQHSADRRRRSSKAWVRQARHCAHAFWVLRVLSRVYAQRSSY